MGLVDREQVTGCHARSWGFPGPPEVGMSRPILLLGRGPIDRSGAKSSEGDPSHGVKGRGRVSGIALTLVLLSILSLAMVPVAQALPLSSPLRAPWTPLPTPLSDPFTPLSGPSGPAIFTPPAPDSSDLAPASAPFTPLSLPDGTEGIASTPGTAPPVVSDGTPGTGFLPLDPPATAAVRTPEPATVILLGMGLLTMIIIGWRRGERVRHR
jgi:PEP-CTERM motif